MNLSFIVIDESELDCFIAKKIIQNYDKNLEIETYQNPIYAIEELKSNTAFGDFSAVKIILLDLQMPLMNGFEFVEEFEQLDAEIRKYYYIHILSSTRNKTDINRLLTYNSVLSVVEKPLTGSKLVLVINDTLNNLNRGKS